MRDGTPNDAGVGQSRRSRDVAARPSLLVRRTRKVEGSAINETSPLVLLRRIRVVEAV